MTVLANGILGGLTVLGDLHPVLVQSHFLLTMASIAFALVAIRRAGTRARAWRTPMPVTRPATGLLKADDLAQGCRAHRGRDLR